LHPSPKICPEPHEQLDNESRKTWAKVTEAIYAKDYAKATQLKQDIEERQRQKAALRKEKDIQFKPRFFEDMHQNTGQPHLSEEGKKALKGMHAGDFKLDAYDF
jgi:hypothetical protein